MRWVVASLAVVVLLALLTAGFGLVAGLMTDATAGVQGRPLIYWIFAASFLAVDTLFWPALLSWYVDLDLPPWHRKLLVPRLDQGGFEDVRSGRRVLDLARSVEPRQRPGIAGRVLGYGLFYAVLSIPLPLMFGVAAMRLGPLRLEEAVPLILALWVPAMWTATVLVRSWRRSSRPG